MPLKVPNLVLDHGPDRKYEGECQPISIQIMSHQGAQKGWHMISSVQYNEMFYWNQNTEINMVGIKSSNN